MSFNFFKSKDEIKKEKETTTVNQRMRISGYVSVTVSAIPRQILGTALN